MIILDLLLRPESFVSAVFIYAIQLELPTLPNHAINRIVILTAYFVILMASYDTDQLPSLSSLQTNLSNHFPQNRQCL